MILHSPGLKDPLGQLQVRREVVLEIRGQPLLDRLAAQVLEGVEQSGSLLAAARSLGLPYSRAWELVSRVEAALGGKVVEAKRGRGAGAGARLTELGRRLLKRYREEERALTGGPPLGAVDLFVAGSHDLALELLLGLVREAHPKLNVAGTWLGSAGGLASLMLGEADVAGIHLLDPATGRYNTPFLGRYWLEDRALLVRGYRREVGFLHPKGEPITSATDILTRGLRLVNRRVGSGCRILLDHILQEAARALGLSFEEAVRGLKGYEWEVSTHLEVARAVAAGRADVGVAVRYAAELYELEFTPITWEEFDFAILASRWRRPGVQAFLEALRSEGFRQSLLDLPGYRAGRDMGEVVYRAR